MERYKGNATISINRVFGGDSDGKIKINITDESNGVSALIIDITHEDLMRAIMGVSFIECNATWQSMNLLGFRKETKKELVKSGELEEYLVDGWRNPWGYNNHHTMKKIDTETYYETTFTRYVKDHDY